MISPILFLFAGLCLPLIRSDGDWNDAHATCYDYAPGTIGGACGYAGLKPQVYDMKRTAALSVALFDDSKACGACFQIKCVDRKWCVSLDPITVTATNECPASDKPNDNGGWCNPPLQHFDLSVPAFVYIGQYKAGKIDVQYRKVNCERKGGIQFTMNGNTYFILVLITNVGGAGDVQSVFIQTDQSSWTAMTRNWGQNWHTDVDIIDKELSIKVQTSDGSSVTSDNVVPADWAFGKTYIGKQFKA